MPVQIELKALQYYSLNTIQYNALHHNARYTLQCNVMQYYILKKVHSPLQCKPSNAKSPQKGQIFAHLYSID